MASQRITVAKVGGISADIVLGRLREWSAARQTDNPNEWSGEQWPQSVRKQADDFADRLRAHGRTPPVVYFVEWADLWSLGDLFERWLTPPDGPAPLAIYSNRFQIFAYALPDGGRLFQHLASAGPQQFAETDWFIARLREAIEAWDKLVERAVIVVLRHAFQGTVSDEEVTASLKSVADWLS